MSKLSEIKKLMVKHKLDAYLVPMSDEFGSEYLAPQFRRIEFISGFTGSNAFIVITKNNAAFFTDGRYTTQSKMEVSSKDFKLFDLAEKTETDFIKENLKQAQIGFDPSIFTVSKIKKYEQTLGSKFTFKAIQENFIDKVWNKKPKPKNSTAFVLDKKFAGKDSKEKIKEVFKNISDDVIFLTNSESINWLLNIRGNDLENTPVCLSYAQISKKGEVELFTYNAKFKTKLPANIKVKNLNEIETAIKKLKNKKVLLDKSSPKKIYDKIKNSGAKINLTDDPILINRAIKNKTESDNIRVAHIKDGAALVKFFYFLEQQLKNKKYVDELQVSEKLIELRKQNENYFSTSFDTIAGFNENGAIIHYRATEKTNKQIKPNGILLVDSGAQYYEGTTDVTRVVATGKPTNEQKRNFTLVLKGHIALAKQRFLKGTNGAQLDILARQFLWNSGLDYKHGTGHGVGYFLNVHEGPHGISKYNNTPLQAGMVISNEPGYYKVGEYGIRIEALVLVKNSGNTGFLEFETLTKCFIDKELIDVSLLNDDERIWLNDYHKQVYDELKNNLNKDEQKFLKEKTNRI